MSQVYFKTFSDQYDIRDGIRIGGLSVLDKATGNRAWVYYAEPIDAMAAVEVLRKLANELEGRMVGDLQCKDGQRPDTGTVKENDREIGKEGD